MDDRNNVTVARLENTAFGGHIELMTSVRRPCRLKNKVAWACIPVLRTVSCSFTLLPYGRVWAAMYYGMGKSFIERTAN